MKKFAWSIHYEYGLSKEGETETWLRAIKALKGELDQIIVHRQGLDEFDHEACPFGFVAKIDEVDS